jgi:hypothetical protein
MNRWFVTLGELGSVDHAVKEPAFAPSRLAFAIIVPFAAHL